MTGREQSSPSLFRAPLIDRRRRLALLFVTRRAKANAGKALDIYHIWCDLKPGTEDLAFVAAVRGYLDRLQDEQQLVSYRITRRKLGLAPNGLKEFHLMLEFDDLSQLDGAFATAATRRDPIEELHAAVFGKVAEASFALYRDFPDKVRTELGANHD